MILEKLTVNCVSKNRRDDISYACMKDLIYLAEKQVNHENRGELMK